MQQLERAITVYEEWVAAGKPVTPAQLIDRHRELGGLLSAMLADRSAVERAIAAADGEGPSFPRPLPERERATRVETRHG